MNSLCIFVEHSNMGEANPCYIPRKGELFRDFMNRVLKTEREQGRRVKNIYSVKMLIGEMTGPIMKLGGG